MAIMSVGIQLTTNGVSPAANLSGLQWAFRSSFAGPAIIASGSTGTTDSTGIFVVSFETSLAAGTVGWLEVHNSDGTLTQSPMLSYSGPAQLF